MSHPVNGRLYWGQEAPSAQGRAGTALCSLRALAQPMKGSVWGSPGPVLPGVTLRLCYVTRPRTTSCGPPLPGGCGPGCPLLSRAAATPSLQGKGPDLCLARGTLCGQEGRSLRQLAGMTLVAELPILEAVFVFLKTKGCISGSHSQGPEERVFARSSGGFLGEISHRSPGCGSRCWEQTPFISQRKLFCKRFPTIMV